MGRIQLLPVNARPAPRDAGLFLRSIEFQNLVPTFVPVRLNSDDGLHGLEPLHASGRYQRKGTERAMDD
jgi:hypothetical protein